MPELLRQLRRRGHGDPNKEFVRSLLVSDKRNFRGIERAQLVRRRSRKHPIRFKIKASV